MPQKNRSQASAVSELPTVNLGNLYSQVTSLGTSQGRNQKAKSRLSAELHIEPLHLALVQIRSPDLIGDATLQGVGQTLSQLSRLGLGCVVVLGHASTQSRGCYTGPLPTWRANDIEQADRVIAAIDAHSDHGARRLDGIVELLANKDGSSTPVKLRGRARVMNRSLLLAPLKRGVIPVLMPVGHTADTIRIAPVEAREVVLALAREFAGITSSSGSADDLLDLVEKVKLAQKEISLDRIIVLDQTGGIPSTNRLNRSHVFINLEQEYETINEELAKLRENSPACHYESHQANLQLIQDTLALLPPSSSALLTTPQEVAGTNHTKEADTLPGVGTRPKRNVLIHNLLTDKPIFSSSLPATRLGPPSPHLPSSGTQSLPSTFIKRGMPLTIIPDPRPSPWTPPTTTSEPLSLLDPRIDFPRLLHLIEDSFGRKLDVDHYLSRISRNLAGIIIAGSYEGAAILTWESPPGLPPSVTPTPDRKVPYLDKFAVLRRSQGAGGVADIIFSAMVRECFPQGVVWRSRQDNPVNKWYFERSRGTWKIPIEGKTRKQGWTMFWTTERVSGERFGDYAGVCGSVVPSWGDGRAVLD
ncbi:MAG: Amino-acid acetyltransferase, mitochondrial [Icmadophila ericetorum]|nr:Amino-acid acetyltransferase, mitochondrial [Icmadophila ericetorum]